MKRIEDVMNMKKNEVKSFDLKWGKNVAKHGYLQTPNILIRNLHAFSLSRNEAMILIYIVSYPEGWNISANQIAQSFSISKNTVRESIRHLVLKGFVHRVFTRGEANKYTHKGYYRALKDFALEIDRPSVSTKEGWVSRVEYTANNNLDRGVTESRHSPYLNTDTNKEQKEDKIKKEKYLLYRKTREDLGI